MVGVVVLAGLFPAGSVVNLVHVEDERTLRAEGGEQVDARVVDPAGNVGFDGLPVGERYFACGYKDGRPLEVRCTAIDAVQAGSELAQPPIGPVTPVIGTQNAPLVEPAQAVPAGLETGVPTDAPPAEDIAADTPLVEVAPDPSAGAGSEGTSVLSDGFPADEEARIHLLAQAFPLGIENAESLSVPELRQSITEKNETPVA